MKSKPNRRRSAKRTALARTPIVMPAERSLDDAIFDFADRALAAAERDPDDFLRRCGETVRALGEVVERGLNSTGDRRVVVSNSARIARRGIARLRERLPRGP